MTVFTVHEGQGVAPALIPYRFSWAAFAFGPLWLAAKKLWLLAALFLIVDATIVISARAGLLGLGAAVVALAIVGALLGFDGNEWERRAISRRGRAISGVVAGSDEIEALAQANAASARVQS
ncbi:MAG: DUF2628 domain-containing protein [Hyphomicrobiales bacterium]|nr:DUF2628 domain-containing protein [Hyphomicrobiales bacterium]